MSITRRIPARQRFTAHTLTPERRSRIWLFEEQEKHEATRARLRESIANEASTLQEVKEEKDLALKDFLLLQDRETTLMTQITALEKELAEAKSALKAEVEKRKGYIADAESKIRQGKNELKESQKRFSLEMAEATRKLKEEISKRMKMAKDSIGEAQKELRLLTDRRNVLQKNIFDLEEKQLQRTEALEKEIASLKLEKETIINKIESEIGTLVKRREEIQFKLRDLNEGMTNVAILGELKQALQKEKVRSEETKDQLSQEILLLEGEIKELSNEKNRIEVARKFQIELFERRRKQNEESFVSEKNRQKTEIANLMSLKNRLTERVMKLDLDVKNMEKELDKEVERKEQLTGSIKAEIKAEQARLDEAKMTLSDLTKKVENLQMVASELEEFVRQERDARIKYLETESALQTAEQKKKAALKIAKKEMEKITLEKKNLDNYKEKMSEFSGRLTASLGVVREATIQLNELLEKGEVPLRFSLPPNVKEINLYE